MVRSLTLGLTLGSLLIAAGCSDAPVVPVTPTNRVVLAELITETG